MALKPSLILIILVSPCHAAVERIVETFDGTGEFDSAEAVVSGLDNPGWFVSGDGKLENGGYSFMNFPGIEEGEDDEAERTILGRGSFVSRMEIRDLTIICMSVTRIADSCGWGVPIYDFVGERDQYQKYANQIDDTGLRQAQLETNMKSIDGLPGLGKPAI